MERHSARHSLWYDLNEEQVQCQQNASFTTCMYSLYRSPAGAVVCIQYFDSRVWTEVLAIFADGNSPPRTIDIGTMSAARDCLDHYFILVHALKSDTQSYKIVRKLTNHMHMPSERASWHYIQTSLYRSNLPKGRTVYLSTRVPLRGSCTLVPSNCFKTAPSAPFLVKYPGASEGHHNEIAIGHELAMNPTQLPHCCAVPS